MLTHLIVSWLISALALWIVAQAIPGIMVRGIPSALVATAVIATATAPGGPIVRFLAFPLPLLTLGLFLRVIIALLMKLAWMFTPGFKFQGFLWGVLGWLVLTIFTAILRLLVF